MPIGDLGQRESGEQLRTGDRFRAGDQRFGFLKGHGQGRDSPLRTLRTLRTLCTLCTLRTLDLNHPNEGDRFPDACPAYFIGEHTERQDVRRTELIDLRHRQRLTRARPLGNCQIDIHSRINSTIRMASASAARPCSPVTTGARPSRTAPTKSSSSLLSGSSPGTACLPPPIFGNPSG